MKFKSLKIPAIIMAIGLVLAVIAHLAVSVVRTPDIASHDFDYSVTYQLDGETKTLEGVYRCSYAGYGKGSNPHDRYYTEEYIVNGEEMLSHACTIAEKDGVELYIVTSLVASHFHQSLRFARDCREKSIDLQGFFRLLHSKRHQSQKQTFSEKCHLFIHF